MQGFSKSSIWTAAGFAFVCGLVLLQPTEASAQFNIEGIIRGAMQQGCCYGGGGGIIAVGHQAPATPATSRVIRTTILPLPRWTRQGKGRHTVGGAEQQRRAATAIRSGIVATRHLDKADQRGARQRRPAGLLAVALAFWWSMIFRKTGFHFSGSCSNPKIYCLTEASRSSARCASTLPLRTALVY